jgi:hypothetical protein
MVLEHDHSYSSSSRLRCFKLSVRKSRPVFEGLKILNIKVEVCEYIFICHSWLEKKNYKYNINKKNSVSLNTIKRIKRTIIAVISEDNKTTLEKLGSESPVHVDKVLL